MTGSSYCICFFFPVGSSTPGHYHLSSLCVNVLKGECACVCACVCAPVCMSVDHTMEGLKVRHTRKLTS